MTSMLSSANFAPPKTNSHLHDRHNIKIQGYGGAARRPLMWPIENSSSEPTSLTKLGAIVWVSEGQLSHLFNGKENGPSKLPFHAVAVPFAP
jgi:hypothetical protein